MRNRAKFPVETQLWRVFRGEWVFESWAGAGEWEPINMENVQMTLPQLQQYPTLHKRPVPEHQIPFVIKL